MANVDIRIGHKDTTWFTANPTLVLKDGQMVVCSDGGNIGKYKIGDGTTQLSALTFYGGVSTTPTWGAITGTLSNQTDLQNALNAKQNTITTGTTAQYFRGDLSLATFPTNVSSFSNDSGYITASALSPYLTSAAAALAYQPLATNLTSLSGLSYASTSFVKMTAAGTFALDTNTYLTGNQSITLSGDASGSGATSISLTLATVNSNIGTFNNVTVNAKGLVTAASNVSYLTGLTIGTTTIGSGTNTRILYNNSGVLGEYAVTGSGTTAVLSTSPTFTTNITSPSYVMSGNISSTAWTTSGIAFKQVASTYTDTTSSGTVASAYTNLFNGATIAASNSTTYTNYYGSYFTVPVVGSNVSFTNTWVAGFNGRVQITGRTYTPEIWSTGVTLDLWTASTNVITANDSSSTSSVTYNSVVRNGGSAISFQFQAPLTNNLTASANIPTFKVTGANKQWAAGTLATQYFNYFSANTVAFASASTATNVYGLYVEAATAGSNATITNNYAAGFSGRTIVTEGNGSVVMGQITTGYSTIWLGQSSPSSSNYTILMTGSSAVVMQGSSSAGLSANLGTYSFIITSSGLAQTSDGLNFQLGSTNGSKIGTATTQKIGFWNATPIVQPSAVTTVQGFYDAMSSIGLIASGTITLPTGYTKSVNNISTNTSAGSAANTEYYYICTASLTLTLPTAVGNTNEYNIKVTSGTLTINTTSSQTIDGSTSATISVANTAVTLISDGSNWQIF